MARRNRKKKKLDAFIFPAPFAGEAILVSALALGYVWLGCRCESLGKEIRQLEGENKSLAKKYLNEEFRWMRAKSPKNLEKALKRYGIVMKWPRRNQVVVLMDAEETGDDVDGSTGDLRYARYAGAMK